ncbi:MAG: PfkB family carbohydrate kinase [Candidatus Lernaella stagnicola]|nr:PfkB family carbohydrate kinase [Candidatus Lernaella stagnicola]
MTLKAGRPLIFGEVLFDVFPDGTEVLGGAPFNVARHLQGFGERPLMITGVGDDARGQAILECMTSWQMDIRGVQVLKPWPTGTVAVHFKDGEPHYDIEADRAYDHVESGSAREAVGGQSISVLYHGTLATRHEQAAQTLADLVSDTGAPRFVDVNLRDPWWAMHEVWTGIEAANWAKMNEAELRLLHGGEGPLREAAVDVLERAMLDGLVVTRGEHGALLVRGEAEVLEEPAAAVTDLADTVGAGDAFSAVLLLGFLRGWPPADTLARASQFAAEICGHRGALPRDAALYEPFAHEWRIA